MHDTCTCTNVETTENGYKATFEPISGNSYILVALTITTTDPLKFVKGQHYRISVVVV